MCACEQGESDKEASNFLHDNALDDLVNERREASDEDKQSHDYMLATNRMRRIIRAPKRYGYVDLIAYVLVATSEMLDDEPFSVSSTLGSKESTKWLDTMKEEMKSLYQNNTSTLVSRPMGSRLANCKWIFKRKDDNPKNKSTEIQGKIL